MSSATCHSHSLLTSPEMARLVGVPLWQIHSAIYRGKLDPPAKLGPTFAWAAADLERVRQCMVSEGYLQAPAGAAR